MDLVLQLLLTISPFVYALPWNEPLETYAAISTANWSPATTGISSGDNLAHVFGRDDTYPMNLCGWQGPKYVGAYCGDDSSCVWFTDIKFVGCCATAKETCDGVYTGCTEGKDRVSNSLHKSCGGSTSLCYLNTFHDDYSQYGCGTTNTGEDVVYFSPMMNTELAIARVESNMDAMTLSSDDLTSEESSTESETTSKKDKSTTKTDKTSTTNSTISSTSKTSGSHTPTSKANGTEDTTKETPSSGSGWKPFVIVGATGFTLAMCYAAWVLWRKSQEKQKASALGSEGSDTESLMRDQGFVMHPLSQPYQSQLGLTGQHPNVASKHSRAMQSLPMDSTSPFMPSSLKTISLLPRTQTQSPAADAPGHAEPSHQVHELPVAHQGQAKNERRCFFELPDSLDGAGRRTQ
ncbi:hypothetical protein BJ878DRAFT_566187 [Calycina marina]|uniref:Uncharacterized protein n=1 Tax=Calycina marina TaxID=1763456 RepID=A0A9P7Z616_9HELO|nr:hypothetical protein BJ878DRAFT_566187 [Calycina marina]